MLNNNKNGLKTAVDYIGKISSGFNLFFRVTGFVGTSYLGYRTYLYYKDGTREDVISRAYAISQSMLDKQYDSVRIKDVELIKKRLTLKPNEIQNNFSVLIGPRGIGKTVAIESAAENLNGVIAVGPVQPGMTKNEILDMVCHKITNRSGSFTENEEFMKKVVDKYCSSTGKVPVIIIQADQRPPNEKPAHLTAAARVLADKFGLNVFIDCSENAFPNNPRTGREIMIELEPMSSDMMRKLPEFKDLLEMLKTQGNDEVVLAICGGVPLLLKDLNNMIKLKDFKNDEEKSSIVRQFVIDQVFVAKENIERLIYDCPKMKDVLKLYEGKANAQVTNKMLLDKLENAAVPDLKGVLRQVRRRYGNVLKPELCPANGAIAIWLRMGSFDSEPDFDEIKTAISMWHKQKENEVEKRQK